MSRRPYCQVLTFIARVLLLAPLWIIFFGPANVLVESKEKTKKCDDNITETVDGMAYWKFRGVRYTTSEDVLCWREENSGELLLRECDPTTGRWLPETVQCRVRNKRNAYCPDDLLEIANGKEEPICLKITTQPKEYDDEFCRGSNIIIQDLSKSHSAEAENIKQFLSSQGIQEFWLPLRRNNDTSPFKVRLPGERWGEVYDAGLSDSRSDKNCLSARYVRTAQMNGDNRRRTDSAIEITTTSCDAILHSVCVFTKPIVARSGCPKGFGALSYRPTDCYGIDWDGKQLPDGHRRVLIDEYFQKRNELRLLLQEFVPKNRKKDPFEMGSFMDDSYTDYEVLMNREEVVQVAYKKETQLFSALSNVVLENRKNAVEMILKIDAELEELVVVVYNQQYIWRIGGDDDDTGVRCFTNADYELVRSTKVDLIWENKEKTKSISKLKLLGTGPGEYWCEAHTIFNFELISTQRVIAVKERRGHAFAMRLEVPCLDASEAREDNLCSNVYKNGKKLGKRVRKLLQQAQNMPDNGRIYRELVIHNARIMSVELITTQSVHCWIHVTASLKASAVDNSEEESSEENNSSEDTGRIRHDTSVRMRVWKLLTGLVKLRSEAEAKSVRSTEYCFPVSFHMGNKAENQWLQAERGQVATTLLLCLERHGMPHTRLCKGDFIHGAYWEELKDVVSCHAEQETTHITESLYNLENSQLSKLTPERVVRDVKDIIEGRMSKLVPADIYFVANIMQDSVKALTQLTLSASTNATTPSSASTTYTDPPGRNIKWNETAADLVAIYNYLMNVKQNTMKLSVQLNSTNKLLEAFENAIDTFSPIYSFDKMSFGDNATMSINEPQSSSDFEVIDYVDIGVSVKISENLVYFVIDPSVAKISGVALFSKNASNEFTETQEFLKGAFANNYYRFLQSNHSIEDFINEPDLELGTYVPEKLLSRLNEIPATINNTQKGTPIIIIKVYSNDRLFQEPLDKRPRTVTGRIVSISIPGYNTDLPELLPLALRSARNTNTSDNETTDLCNYWNFESWASDGVIFLGHSEANHNIILCGCSHLTPFAYLVGGGSDFSVDDDFEGNIRQTHEKALDIITLVGCSLSLLGICGIFITAAVFESWRQKASSKVLLQLSAAIALQMVIFCFVNTEEYSLHLIINDIMPSCVAIGACLHYSVLVQFFWMMVIAYLQFKRYVQVFGQNRPQHFFLKSAFFCWGLPLIPVVLVILLDKNSFGEGGICYPSGHALYFGIIMPIGLIILANFIIFCLVIFNISRGPSAAIRHTDKRILISQIRLSVLLFFLLGFTWGFGLLSTMKSGIVFSYLFCLTATLQGFVIFVYFIVLDPVTRRMWGRYIRSICGFGKGSLESTASLKDTTETF